MKKRSRQRPWSSRATKTKLPEPYLHAAVCALRSQGCHTQGRTLEETERNVKEAIELYLESLAAHHEPIPVEGRSFHGRVTVPSSAAA